MHVSEGVAYSGQATPLGFGFLGGRWESGALHLLADGFLRDEAIGEGA